MHFVFVMDPVSTVKVQTDTSFALMLEAQTRGHRVDHCLATEVFLDEGAVSAIVRRAQVARRAEGPITLGERETVRLAEVDAVFIRKDPPFDREYLWLTQILELLRGKTLVLNDPRGLREANEKLYTLQFPELVPETLVTADEQLIRDFVTRVGGRAVLKPVDGYAGTGIFSLIPGDANFGSAIETLTEKGRRHVIAQRYLPEIVQGDKRVLLLEGKPLGAFFRVPQGGDVRSNMRVGGRIEGTELTDADRRIIARIAPRLLADGLYFVGLDIIGDRLTEVNCTSPTGLQQMAQITGRNLAGEVIEAVEARARGGN
jgi:glutathione synthase